MTILNLWSSVSVGKWLETTVYTMLVIYKIHFIAYFVKAFPNLLEFFFFSSSDFGGLFSLSLALS